jgi:hypothetical protein
VKKAELLSRKDQLLAKDVAHVRMLGELAADGVEEDVLEDLRKVIAANREEITEVRKLINAGGK